MIYLILSTQSALLYRIFCRTAQRLRRAHLLQVSKYDDGPKSLVL